MKCEVIQDLMILYSDNCCCEESRNVVEEHISICDNCRKVFEEIKTDPLLVEKDELKLSITLTPVNQWKGSILQSVLLFLSFALLTLGVALEASTPSGNTNGVWAISIIIPTTGFLISLANWYFLRQYKSRKSFSNSSLLVTFFLTICGYLWAVFNYGTSVLNLFLIQPLTLLGLLLFITFCILSKTLSNMYGKISGKE